MAGKDIVRKYEWTSVPRNSQLREEGPQIIVTSHKLKSNPLQPFIGWYKKSNEMEDGTAGTD